MHISYLQNKIENGVEKKKYCFVKNELNLLSFFACNFYYLVIQFSLIWLTASRNFFERDISKSTQQKSKIFYSNYYIVWSNNSRSSRENFNEI